MVTAALPKETTHESLELGLFVSSKVPDAIFSLEEFDDFMTVPLKLTTTTLASSLQLE
jgi:hypothetical protein